ncbi:MAG TPA: hypothetical protein PLJ78_12850 [Anaerolineae bacterium]|nr:hypothetical protein [Anaerolineae bacterium]HQK14819.1 hypothetical protein [Anaerolineae bacterium]
MKLTDSQNAIIQAPFDRKIFLEGPAGAGKTTTGVGRLVFLLLSGVPAERILVLTPQRTLATPYNEALYHPDIAAGGLVNVATVGGLARRMVDLFWPLVVEEAGFGKPDERPIFLTLETAQYYMARIVTPLVEEQGYFEAINIDRNRLYSQILDNLNKAAVVGFPYTEIAERLRGAWVGESAQGRTYDQAQECAARFRRYCLEHNLLDFSLQLDVFFTHLWTEPLCRDYLLNSYTHLLVDNVEEDVPVAHDLIYSWLPHAESALIIFDQDAGYRSFLGADPVSAYALREMCDEQVTFNESFVASPPVQAFGDTLGHILQPGAVGTPPVAPAPDLKAVLHFESCRYHPDMLDWTADTIAALVHNDGLAPGEIVVLAPFLTDALRFSLTHRLEQRDVPVRSHRPSRALREEPATQTLLTWAALAHPQWGILPRNYDVAYALMETIADLDLVRAQLLAEVLYRVKDNTPSLAPFDGVNPDMQQRITYIFGGRYEALRLWLDTYRAGDAAPLDHFLARLFGEVLSQPGYGFHQDFDAARVAAMLIESVQKFRWIATDLPADKPLGQEYLEMVQRGVIAAQYLEPWKAMEENSVLLAPAYTFLLSNRPVDVQFWLNVGGTGWWERLYQPLTHPYVLSRRWPKGQPWTDTDEVAMRQTALRRLVIGLVRRCRKAIYLGLSELGEQGYEQTGPLLKAIQRVLRT